MKHLLTMVAFASLVTVCGCVSPPKTDGESAAHSTPSTDQPPTKTELASATYNGIEEQGAITLADGKWEGEPFVDGGASVPAIQLTDRFYLAGDLDGDGTEEAVAHLTFNAGGTGQMGYLAAMGREDDAIVQRGLASVGDRVRIYEARIEDGRVVLEVLQVGPEDGMCCPTQLVTRTFAMQGGTFVESSTEVIGTVSLAILEDREWVLSKLSSTDPAPSEPEISLRIEGDRISGSSGCNSYNGTAEQSETPTDLVIGLLMTTRQACPPDVMNLEQRYIGALQGAQSWDLLFGQLIINYLQGDEYGSLFFEARELSSGS